MTDTVAVQYTSPSWPSSAIRIPLKVPCQAKIFPASIWISLGLSKISARLDAEEPATPIVALIGVIAATSSKMGSSVASTAAEVVVAAVVSVVVVRVLEAERRVEAFLVATFSSTSTFDSSDSSRGRLVEARFLLGMI